MPHGLIQSLGLQPVRDWFTPRFPKRVVIVHLYDSDMAEPSPPPAYPDGYQRHAFDIESAIRNRSSSFDLWVVVAYNALEKFNPSTAERELYQGALRGVYAAFEADHGNVTKSFFCREFRCATAITSRSMGKEPTVELHVVFNILETTFTEKAAVQLDQLLYECKHLMFKANELLVGSNLIRCLDEIYWIVTDVGAGLDRMVAVKSDVHTQDGGSLTGTPPTEDLIKDWTSMFERTKEFYERSVKRASELYYFFGMLWGFLGIAVAGVGLGFIASHQTIRNFHLDYGLGAFVAGAVGAMVSVMWRMSHDNLSLNYEAGRRNLMLLGAFRPVIGMVFGLFSYVVFASGLFHVEAAGNGTQQFFFYCALAFIAGFSERYAQDMLNQAEGAARTAAGS